jgi:uncharacterized membrane protein
MVASSLLELGVRDKVDSLAVTPRTRRCRRAFAFLRVVQITLAVLGTICFLLIFSVREGKARLYNEVYLMARATPLVFVEAGAVLLVVAAALQLLALVLKRRWRKELLGWIN